MNGQAQAVVTQEMRLRAIAAIWGGSIAESIVGIGAIVLSALAFLGYFTLDFASIAAMAIGVSLLFEGSAVTTRLLKYLEVVSNHRVEIADLNAGASIESMAGVAGVALGLLTLLGVGSFLLLPIAAMAFGVAIILGGGVTSNLNNQILRLADQPEEYKFMVTRMMGTASDLELLIGMGVVVLGILALLGINTVLLTLAAFIAVGASDVLKSTSIGSRLARTLRSGRHEIKPLPPK